MSTTEPLDDFGKPFPPEPTARLQPGDIVEFLDQGYGMRGLTPGKTYEVEIVSGPSISFRDDNGIRRGAYADRFRLYFRPPAPYATTEETPTMDCQIARISLDPACEWEYVEEVGLPHAVFDAHLAEVVHALYAGRAPEGDDDPYETPAELAARIRELEAEVQRLTRRETELDAKQRATWETSQKRAQVIFDLQGENARLRAELDDARAVDGRNALDMEVARLRDALEKADALLFARDNFEASETVRQEAEAGAAEARHLLVQRREQYDAARQALTEGASGGES